jgi:hypothetical protein
MKWTALLVALAILNAATASIVHAQQEPEGWYLSDDWGTRQGAPLSSREACEAERLKVLEESPDVKCVHRPVWWLVNEVELVGPVKEDGPFQVQAECEAERTKREAEPGRGDYLYESLYCTTDLTGVR